MRMATLTVVAAGLCSAAVTHAQILSPVLANNAPLSGDVAREIVAEAEARARADASTESSGPWGTLRVSYVYISAPDAILQLFQAPSAVTRWIFVGMTKDEIVGLLDDPDSPAAMRADASDAARWTIVGDHIQFCPSAEAVLALPPRVRSRIYAVLAQWEVNEFHYDPYFVPEGDIDCWIGAAGLRPEVVDAVTKTAYRRGRSLCFSDLSLLVSMTRSHAELRTIIKALSRTRTALLSLKLDASSDITRIRDYWSSGNANAKDFVPLLESVAANPTIPQIDLVHMLPPYARKLCYTYPHPSHAVAGRYPDCHWTSLNFFNYRPEDRFFDTDGAGMFVRERCNPGEGPYQFGDILFFTDFSGHGVHSCVYLADDFVFTKNGANVLSPWLIMKLADVVERYSVNGEPSIKIYRRRE
jgi:hypothetical protein